MIKLTEINKIYRTNEIETVALENVNLEVEKGEFLSIMGPSGCGKSTLLNIMGLLDAPTSGTIEIAGTKVDGMKDKELAAFRNKTLGFVFQSFHLINSLNVIDNVELPLLYRKMAAKERTRLAKEVLDRVGLSHRMRHMPTQLSGGQCQRVAIARAIVGNPEIILADEPTGALDSETSIQVMELLKEIAKDKLVIMVTHNPELAEQYANRIVRIKDGTLTGDSNPYTPASGLIGVGISYLAIIPINAIVYNLTGIEGLKAFLPPQAAVVLVAISMVLTLIAGLIPSRVASKKAPVEALRTE